MSLFSSHKNLPKTWIFISFWEIYHDFSIKLWSIKNQGKDIELAHSATWFQYNPLHVWVFVMIKYYHVSPSAALVLHKYNDFSVTNNKSVVLYKHNGRLRSSPLLNTTSPQGITFLPPCLLYTCHHVKFDTSINCEDIRSWYYVTENHYNKSLIYEKMRIDYCIKSTIW